MKALTLTLILHRPPKSWLLSKQVGSRPSSKQALMLVRPDGPAPITATFCTMLQRKRVEHSCDSQHAALQYIHCHKTAANIINCLLFVIIFTFETALNKSGHLQKSISLKRHCFVVLLLVVEYFYFYLSIEFVHFYHL